MRGISKILRKGFQFGMLLQLSIGPVCIYIFQTASKRGFFIALTAVLGVVLADGLFMLAAILGIASFMEKKNIQMGLKIFGALILFLFGLNMCLGTLDIHILPQSMAFYEYRNNSFVQAILLTISNPLTILFWAGVFSARIAESCLKKKDIQIFGLGALLSTLSFLTMVSFLGSLVKVFISPAVISIMNFIVGVLLVYFSIKMVLKRADG